MPTEIVKVRVECEQCDGCGWYEGGPFLDTTCEYCGGKGFVFIDQEKEIEHKFVEGTWGKQEKSRSYIRKDACSLCGMKKVWVRSSKNSTDEFVSLYIRSNQFYSSENPPDCWGGKSPE